jgi:uncharacterized protein
MVDSFVRGLRNRASRYATIAALTALAGAVVASFAGGQTSDPLPRRGQLGTGLANAGGHVHVTAVIPGSAAAAAGLQAGDVITSVNGRSVAASGAAIAALRLPAGTSVSLAVTRSGNSIIVTAVLLPAPKETDSSVKTLYQSVSVNGTLRRVLVTMPADARGPFPAVMIVGGIGCYAIDNSNPQDAYRNLTHDLSRRGFLTLRLEKSGIGDSQGPPCSTVDFDEEVQGYDAALKWLSADPLVDSSRLYLFGHSIGGVIAPRLAATARVGGVVVAETVGINWFEYELINQRRQLQLSGADPSTVDSSMKTFQKCLALMEIDGETYAAIDAAHPECAEPLSIYPVPPAYMKQVAALDIAQPWMALRVPALVIYGTSDFITDESDHRGIVDTVNSRHPGSARLVTIDGMDHYLTVVATQKESLDRADRRAYGPYDHKLSVIVGDWLCSLARCPVANEQGKSG